MTDNVFIEMWGLPLKSVSNRLCSCLNSLNLKLVSNRFVLIWTLSTWNRFQIGFCSHQNSLNLKPVSNRFVIVWTLSTWNRFKQVLFSSELSQLETCFKSVFVFIRTLSTWNRFLTGLLSSELSQLETSSNRFVLIWTLSTWNRFKQVCSHLNSLNLKPVSNWFCSCLNSLNLKPVWIRFCSRLNSLNLKLVSNRFCSHLNSLNLKRTPVFSGYASDLLRQTKLFEYNKSRKNRKNCSHNKLILSRFYPKQEFCSLFLYLFMFSSSLII